MEGGGKQQKSPVLIGLNFPLSKMPGVNEIQLNLDVSTTQQKLKFVRGDNVLSYQES